MTTKNLPVTVQNNRNAPQERAIADIIQAVNQLLTYNINFNTVNYIPMGYVNTVGAPQNTWTNMTVDNSNPAYYMNDVDTFLLNTTLVVNASTSEPNGASFRLINSLTGQVMWTSGVVAVGAIVLGGKLTYGQVKLLANQPYNFQYFVTASLQNIRANVAMKVAY